MRYLTATLRRFTLRSNHLYVKQDIFQWMIPFAMVTTRFLLKDNAQDHILYQLLNVKYTFMLNTACICSPL